MDLVINPKPPTIMHIDFNSCFASAEQQANHFLRGKAMAVAAYDFPNGCIISPSIEAKKIGIKVGMRVKDAKFIYPKLIIRLPDPAKYRDIHLKFCHLFKQYSPLVTPKSIDEAVLDFSGMLKSKCQLINIAKDIKDGIKKEIGDWLLCNIGISTNRFLAKLAASLHKPNGLDVIDKTNLLNVYKQVTLLDLNGINLRFQARLNSYNIFTPPDFFKAGLTTLKKQVFKSICGYYWYLRLRGWEIDSIDFKRRSFGQSYALHHYAKDIKTIRPMLSKLCEKMARRLRRAGYMAKGVNIGLLYDDRTFWHKSHTFPSYLYTTQEFFIKALLIFNCQQSKKRITHLFINCYNLTPASVEQLELFTTNKTKRIKLAKAMDEVNDTFGEFTLIPANMMGMGNVILDRVAFGGVKELEDLYSAT